MNAEPIRSFDHLVSWSRFWDTVEISRGDTREQTVSIDCGEAFAMLESACVCEALESRGACECVSPSLKRSVMPARGHLTAWHALETGALPICCSTQTIASWRDSNTLMWCFYYSGQYYGRLIEGMSVYLCAVIMLSRCYGRKITGICYRLYAKVLIKSQPKKWMCHTIIIRTAVQNHSLLLI